MKFEKAFEKWLDSLECWSGRDFDLCVKAWETCEEHMAGLECKNCKIAVEALEKYNNHILWESGSCEGNLDNWCGSLNGFDFAQEALKLIKGKDEPTL